MLYGVYNEGEGMAWYNDTHGGLGLVTVSQLGLIFNETQPHQNRFLGIVGTLTSLISSLISSF